MRRPLTRASTAGRRAAALRAAPVVEAIDLLSDESEDESEDEEVIELLDSDDYEVIEILDSSEEEEDSEEDDVQISCLDMIVVRDRVKEKYGALVRAIKRLKSSLPFVVRILKVKGHSKARDAHAVGNDAAHRLAYRCSAHQPVCTLPV
ncbi:hypothetical protein OEZ85_005269 [Tetradesmus obliquus]|uniref:RNase H type-1 domain-containing protein n=1 Tax=Tetradesmus obliquus TaxID=3088 RepID=A0ABY8UKT5_TETOB|nr:hypothetical protein OEZ85_005269 [Tetradesmus obliquus]